MEFMLRGCQKCQNEAHSKCEKDHQILEPELVKFLQWDAIIKRNLRMSLGIFGWIGSRGSRHRRIVVGLKSDNCSREMLLRLLHLVVVKGDSVLAVHVQQSESDDIFDPNTFHMYEDVCKQKQVDFEVKICTGSCYITELANQIRLTFATVLAIGCNNKWPKSSTIAKYKKSLPPTCKLLIMDNGGKVLFEDTGTSQQGSRSTVCRTFTSSLSESNTSCQPKSMPPVRKTLSMPSSSTSSTESAPRLAMLNVKAHSRRFTFEELKHATENFSPCTLIGEVAKSRVYKGVVENGQTTAVKVLKASKQAEESFVREVEILSGLKHENIVELVGYCYCEEMYAVVYDSFCSSLKQRLNQLKWSERIKVAVGVAKALDYLHSSYHPVIHTDINSSNVVLSEDGKPQLSDFGDAKVLLSTDRSLARKRLARASGHVAREYVMYGKVDEKIDVYSYGIVLLELITGKEAIATSPASNQESLVLWARSLLTCGLYERLIDPSLNEDYNKDEMKALVIVARLCLLHSSSRRPTMKTILHFLEEPNDVLQIQKMSGGDLLGQIETENNEHFGRDAEPDTGCI